MDGYGVAAKAPRTAESDDGRVLALSIQGAVDATKVGDTGFGVKERTGDNKPEKRRNLILAHLHKYSAICEVRGVEGPTKEACAKMREDDPDRCLEYANDTHDRGFLQFLAEAHDLWHKAGHDDSFSYQPDGPLDGFVPYHFLRASGNRPPGKHIESAIGFYANDVTVPIFDDTHWVLEEDLVIMRHAIDYIQGSKSSARQRFVYCFTCMPGHHVAPFHYGGYCYLNYAALAACKLTKSGFNVGILDVDYHGGDGTLHIVREVSNVCKKYMSIHSGRDYPYIDFGEYGLEFEKGATWDKYSPVLDEALRRILESDVNVLVVSVGLDTLGGDPDASDLAGCDLKPEDFREMGHVFKRTNLPILMVQEGGYNLADVPKAVEQLLQGLADEVGPKA